MGVFVQIVAQLFSADFYPEAVVPSLSLMVLAVGMGILFYKRGLPLLPLTVAGFVLSLGAVGLGLVLPAPDLPPDAWSAMMMVYAFVASILPVWLLLQPRDYLNSLLLYLGLISLFGGFFLLRPEFVAPAVDLHPPGAPPLFPFVFIVLACGAISGFHALVSSGTTAKQISRETDAPFIGYGAMIGESLLGLIAVMACTAGFLNTEAWQAHYASWNVAEGLGQSMSAFIDGSALFLGQLGVPATVGRAFIALVAVSFALTTLDSATRLLRYNIQEVSETLGLPVLSNRYLSSLLAVAAIGAFAFLKVDGQPAGLALWALFGTTNQLLGGLTLITVTLYLFLKKKNCLYTFVPMVFMVITTVAAMSWNVLTFYREGQTLLLVLGIALLLLAAWVVVEGMLRFARLLDRAGRIAGGDQRPFPSGQISVAQAFRPAWASRRRSPWLMVSSAAVVALKPCAARAGASTSVNSGISRRRVAAARTAARWRRGCRATPTAGRRPRPPSTTRSGTIPSRADRSPRRSFRPATSPRCASRPDAQTTG